jgi:phage terminase large subunit-like protein
MSALAANPLAPQVALNLPAKLLPILEPRRFKIMHGGRGGAKSHTVAQVLLMLSMQRKLRILCVREVQKSLKDSVWQLLLDYMARHNLATFFDVVKSESRITCKLTGSTFAFSGLKDHTADSIKSFEGVDIVWAEEAHSITAHSWGILIPTILRVEGSEIWATFNPDDESDYVYDRFVKHVDPNAWVVAINWRDNPWFNEAMNTERLTLKAINDDLYEHVWEGKCRSTSGLLFKRRWFNRYELGKHPDRLNRYIASDYAAGPDPDNPDSDPDWTEHGCAGLDEKGDLWFVDWWSGQEDPAVWVNAWLAMIRRNKPLIAFEEKGVILRTMDGAINKAMRETKTFVAREALASAGNKASRALGFAARASAGTIWIPNCEWGDRLVNQLCAFNGQDGRTDDMVDVCSLLARGLDEMADAQPPAPPKPKAPAPFTGDWLERMDAQDEARQRERAAYYE